MRQRENRRWPTRHTSQNAEQRRCKDSNENCAFNLAHHQYEHNGEPCARQLRFVIREAAETDKARRMRARDIASRTPTNAITIPTPPAVECFRQSGIPLTICSRTRVTVRTRKITPEMKIP